MKLFCSERLRTRGRCRGRLGCLLWLWNQLWTVTLMGNVIVQQRVFTGVPGSLCGTQTQTHTYTHRVLVSDCICLLLNVPNLIKGQIPSLFFLRIAVLKEEEEKLK